MSRKKKEETAKEKNQTFQTPVFAHGRRKEATARVRLDKNGGQIFVNDKSIKDYFPGEVAKAYYLKPFQVTETMGKFSAKIKVEGSGKSGQLGAVVHGITNALITANPAFKSILRKVSFVTRDPRKKERRKYGLAQKARKRKQSPKR